jgi:hypothetical protein
VCPRREGHRHRSQVFSREGVDKDERAQIEDAEVKLASSKDQNDQIKIIRTSGLPQDSRAADRPGRPLAKLDR